jgi:mono/diheme cytochrome c family protein
MFRKFSRMILPMKTTNLVLLLCATLLDPLSGFAQSPAPATPPAVAKVDYATQVKPIFQNYCYQCHGNGRGKGGVRLDVKANAMMHITAGDPMHSDVYRSITRSTGTSDHMPPVSQKQPGDADIATIKLWIQQGAVWPDAPPK